MVIVLTGGPGGGKSTLLRELANDPEWWGRFVPLPEAVGIAVQTGVSPAERLLQRIVVEVQRALEEGLARALGPGDSRAILCNRGTLDPLAFWRDRGWPAEEFYPFVGVMLDEHYARYTAVLHLVTAADGAPEHYARWPEAHRPEEPEHAVRLDHFLTEAWGGHPWYFRLGNEGRNWAAKSAEARAFLRSVATQVGTGCAGSGPDRDPRGAPAPRRS